MSKSITQKTDSVDIDGCSAAEADFLWQELAVGDRIQVSNPVRIAGLELLTPGIDYPLVAKPMDGSQTLIVESNLPGRLVTLYPHQLSNYENGQRIPLC